jgi:hypothetical protein
MSKTNTLLIFVGSVGFILVAIIFTSILTATRSSSSRQDTRTRASEDSETVFYGTAGGYDEASNILTVEGLMFSDSDGKTLGTWKITAPPSFSALNFPPGTNLKISGSPASFNISQSTLTAVKIEKR